MLEVGPGAPPLVSGLGVGPPPGIRQHDGRVAANAERLLEFLILLEEGLAHPCLVPGEVDFNQDVAILHTFSKFLMVENLLFQALAPATPIRAGEVDQEILLLLPCLFPGRREVGLPARSCPSGGEPKGADGNGN